ncbi:MAG: pyridoxal 5'-phosphate synthase glutaminase subunit PdxT [Cumulibacter sp.]
MSSPTIGVLALQGDVAEHRGALQRAGAQAVAVRRPNQLAGLDGILLPGGESTTIDKLLRAFALMDPLRTAIRGGLPAYGSCAGMILLADRLVDGRSDQQTIGGIDMTVRRNAFGRQVDSFESTVHMPLVGDAPMRAVFIRAPWVETTGNGVEILGRVEDGPAAGRIVAVRQGNIIATSFHPEVTADFRVHDAFVDLVRSSAAS